MAGVPVKSYLWIGVAQVLETAEKAASYEYSRVSGLSLAGPLPLGLGNPALTSVPVPG